MTGELFVSFGDSPTRRRLLERLHEEVSIPESVLRGDPDATAAWLTIPPAVYAEHPLTNRPHVMARIVQLLGDEAWDPSGLWDLLEAWDWTFADGRPYKVSTVGLETAAESWLVAHLPRLRLHGFPVDLAHQQPVLPNGRRPDLLCRFNDTQGDAAADDWLVVELKATRFYDAAADQVASYVAEVQEHLAHGRAVHALLITDGADHAEIEDLRDRGIAHLSLAALGYRQHLAQEHRRPRPLSLSTSDTVSPSAEVTSGSGGVEFDGPETYWIRLFWDRTNGSDDVQQRNAAGKLWARRESRRARYEHEWGDAQDWPAQHPTTLLDAPGTPWQQVAVCIQCDWLARPTDTGTGTDLFDVAKEHALAHPHDARLEAGENPIKPPPPADRIRAAIARARTEAQRRARRQDDDAAAT